MVGMFYRKEFLALFKNTVSPTTSGTCGSENQPSLRDLCISGISFPNVETLGYCHSVLPGRFLGQILSFCRTLLSSQTRESADACPTFLLC
jgi:hypothetical protein